jgi:hypothetical protein
VGRGGEGARGERGAWETGRVRDERYVLGGKVEGVLERDVELDVREGRLLVLGLLVSELSMIEKYSILTE